MAKKYIEDIKLSAIRNKIFASLSESDKVNIFTVISLSSGDYLPTQNMIDGGYNVYGGGGITDKKHNVFNVQFETLGIGRVGARCGCVFKIKPQSWITDNALYASKIDDQFDLEFLIHFLNFKNFNQYANTSAQPVISLKRISGISIPKIDLKLQKEIVILLNNIEKGIIEIKNDKYGIRETLNFLKSKEYIDVELTNQLSLVKKLRQQLLQDALQGKLVEQNKKDEPGIELLKKIKAEKEKLITEKTLKKEKKLPPVKAEEIPFAIPDNWAWCKLGDVSEIKRGKSPMYSEHGISKMLNQKCIRWYSIDTQFSKAINETWFNNIHHDFVVKENDVLVNSTGEGTIGRSAIADKIADGFIFDSHILNLRSYINQKYICYFINSDFGQNLVNRLKGATSTKQTELGVNNLTNFSFPLPPLFEQQRIVQKLEQLMQNCIELEESIKQSASQNENLLQQVLREALRKEEVEKV
ncbi:MAG: restriction endonuclease subunit S [Bacteroidota bacterium]